MSAELTGYTCKLCDFIFYVTDGNGYLKDGKTEWATLAICPNCGLQELSKTHVMYYEPLGGRAVYPSSPDIARQLKEAEHGQK